MLQEVVGFMTKEFELQANISQSWTMSVKTVERAYGNIAWLPACALKYEDIYQELEEHSV